MPGVKDESVKLANIGWNFYRFLNVLPTTYQMRHKIIKKFKNDQRRADKRNEKKE